MNLLQHIIYFFLSAKEKGLKLSLNRYLRSSATVSTTKNIISGNCSLTLNSQTLKNIELVKQNMADIVKNSNFNSEFLLDFVKKKGVKVVFIKNINKILTLLNEEEGLVLERKGFCAFILNIISGSGIGFKSKPLLLLEKGHRDFYFLLFHFYKLYSYFQKLPGLDLTSQQLFKVYSKNPEKSDLSQLSFEEMTALQEAISRDNEASSFVIELSKLVDGTRKALDKMQDGGASL